MVGKIAGVAVLGVLMTIFLSWFALAENPETPAGYVGYLKQGSVFGSTRFYGVQTGPSSPGRTWLLGVVNVPTTPLTYTEHFTGDSDVLAKDNLRVRMDVSLMLRIRPNGVQDFIEQYASSQQKNANPVDAVYQNFLQQPLRTIAREEVHKRNGLTVKEEVDAICQTIEQKMSVLSRGSPIAIEKVVVGNLQYPNQVADAVSAKLAATQRLEQKQTEIEITKKDAERRVAEAEGIAKAMQIINGQLNTAYLQHEAIEAQKAMVGSENHTTVYIPVGPMGVPVVAPVDGNDRLAPHKKK